MKWITLCAIVAFATGCAGSSRLELIGPVTVDSMSTVKTTTPTGVVMVEVRGSTAKSPAAAELELELAKLNTKVEIARANARRYAAYNGSNYQGPGYYGSSYYGAQPGRLYQDNGHQLRQAQSNACARSPRGC